MRNPVQKGVDMSRILRPEQQTALKRRIFVDVNFWKGSLPGFALISDGLSVVAKCRCPEQGMTSTVSKVSATGKDYMESIEHPCPDLAA
jgi:hypothetical protein